MGQWLVAHVLRIEASMESGSSPPFLTTTRARATLCHRYTLGKQIEIEILPRVQQKQNLMAFRRTYAQMRWRLNAARHDASSNPAAGTKKHF